MLASNPLFVQWVLKAKSNIDSGQFKPMQLAAVAALSNSDDWHGVMNSIYGERRAWGERIMDLLGCTYDKQQAGLFVWGKMDDEVTDSESFTNELLYQARVFITPGFIFGSNGERFIRISLGASVDKLMEAHQRIKTYLNI